jgi:hypothetical protein
MNTIRRSAPLNERERELQSYLNRWMVGGGMMFVLLVASWGWFGWTMARRACG